MEKVKKSKKNRGVKRKLWQAEVKAYHAGRGKGCGKNAQESTAVKAELPTHPNAPWWKNPYTADAVEIDNSDQELQEAKPVDDAVDGPILMPRIFGP